MALQLVPAVTELILAEMWYLQIDDDRRPINLYINSTGTTRADGETVSCPASRWLQQPTCCAGSVCLSIKACLHSIASSPGFPEMHGLVQVGFETEGTAIYDMMKHLSCPVGACFLQFAAWLCVVSTLSLCLIRPYACRQHTAAAAAAWTNITEKRRLLQVYTVDIGVAVGQSCMLLAAGHKGHRFMLEHATGVLLLSMSSILHCCWWDAVSKSCSQASNDL